MGRLEYDQLHPASKVMIPTYPAFAIVLGSTYCLTPEDVLMRTPAFRYASELLPMPVWGWLFILVGLAQVAILLLSRSSFAYALLLAVMGMSMVVWALVLAGATLFGQASLSGWLWPLFVAQACRASAKAIGAVEE